MKATLPLVRTALLFAAFGTANLSLAQSQGRVVINEYMPWTSNGCGTTAEFVELFNFGPGPVNIGCYVLTTGVYSITIPPNTIIYPGQFYVLAGQNFIPNDCANIDSIGSGVHANLNWNTCNCTNTSIPQTGEGMMKDGGTSNTPLVLLDPSLNVVDAVVRSTPTEPTQTIASSSVSGACTSQTFNIGTMNPVYEVLGMSAGRGNSFARTLDGDCVWVKDPQQSANASNNRTGQSSDISYDLAMVSATSCTETGPGYVSIYVRHSDYTSIFPMSYTIATDVNNDGIFDFNDQYSTFSDATPPYIEINNLPLGHYKIVVSSKNGCYLEDFDFTIIPCNPGVLPVKLVYFKNKEHQNGRHELEWLLQDTENLQSIVVEKSDDGNLFVTDQVISGGAASGTRIFSTRVEAAPSVRYYRLRITQTNGKVFYSPVLNTASEISPPTARMWPNPATNQLHLEWQGFTGQKTSYRIYNSNGAALVKGTLAQSEGSNKAVLPLPASLPPGVYQLQLFTGKQYSFRFVKQ